MWLLGQNLGEHLHRALRKDKPAVLTTVARCLTASVSLRISELAHGCRIFVDSTLGKGTCFTVELPTGQEALWQRS